MINCTTLPIKYLWRSLKSINVYNYTLVSKIKNRASFKSGKPSKPKTIQMREPEPIQQRTNQQKQAVLKTYLQIIPPYRIQELLHPEKTNISQFTNLAQGKFLQKAQLEQLHKKIKKSVHMIPIESLTKALEVLPVSEQSDQQCKALSRKIYTKILNNVHKKMNNLTLEQIVDFMYKMVKLNYKEFQFMKEVERIIIEQKIKINYPLIRKILWAYTHLDAGSSVLYSHISKTLKIGQHQFSPLELAESAYMLSKTSQNATGGYGVFLIAQKHLLAHLPRLQFHDLVKAASYMFTQNIGSNDFQLQLQAELYKKYPNKPNLRLNDLVTLLKSTSGYYFKYKEKALLNMLQTSTRKVAPEANLQQFEDIIWSWGRAGKGDKELWSVLEDQINNKFISLLKPRQLAFFYFSLCSNEHASVETIKDLQSKFMSLVSKTPQVSKHYLLKFLLGMQKRKDYSENSFAKISSLIPEHMDKLSIKQLVTFAKVINESDLCYENKDKFQDMEKSLIKVCNSAIAEKIYMFRISELVQILYMWIKLDVSDDHKVQTSQKFVETIFSHLSKSTHEIPKSVFIKSLFCFTIKDKYEQAIEMIAILQSLLKYGSVSYFFSPLQLPLAGYCIFHLVVNSGNEIKISKELIYEIGQAMDKINPVTLNKFVRNGYEQCLRLKAKYHQANPEATHQETSKRKKK